MSKLKIDLGTGNEQVYSVWVGGVEVNDTLLTKAEAEDLANEYKADGYDDVIIDDYREEN
jgi:hypothetical protein